MFLQNCGKHLQDKTHPNPETYKEIGNNILIMWIRVNLLKKGYNGR
jgi:hypothetical protein